MVSSEDFQKAVELIDKSETILITAHIRLDGDASGCMAAMDDVFTALGKKVKLLLLSPIPEWYRFLFTELPPILGDDVSLEQLQQGQFADPDLVIIVDTNSYSQLPEFEKYLKQADKPVLIIDHHATADGLGDVELTEKDAAAAGLIVYDFIKYAKWPITEKIAEALFVAAATDTGWFQFNNTDSRVFNSCAELINAGANPAQIYYNLYQNYSHQRFKLKAAMFNTLELHLDGRFATQHILLSDFAQSGAEHKDTENLIDECRRIRTVEAAALFVESEDGRFRCSLRSRGAVNVGKIAQKFGGGGHKMAAGLFLSHPLEKAKQLILTEITQQFEKSDSK
ncbi:MAG: bifunctional oligoribonuclease/PAP phosphatase NrnA [Planctomycetes bacterium]|nr:bifunctional oligoribonuclease/PAP phosphatase NrnA [Planctomycetota bacterium]